MPQITRDLLIHQDNRELTYHSSVSFPDTVPVNVDCNSEMVIGRAKLRHDDNGRVWADLYLHESFDGIPWPYTCLIGVTPQTVLFHSEVEDTNYLIYGGVEYIALLSAESDVIQRAGEELE